MEAHTHTHTHTALHVFSTESSGPESSLDLLGLMSFSLIASQSRSSWERSCSLSGLLE